MAAPADDGDAVRVFLRLVARSQTRELCEWSAESLRRALLWAKAAERAALSAELKLAGLPTVAGRPLVPSDLRRATQHLLLAVLTSPFLATHPIRSEIVGLVMREAREQQRVDAESSLISQSAIAAALARRVVDAKREDVAAGIARAVGRSFRPVRVSMLNGTVTVPPVESYLTKPRTVHLFNVALALQRNAASARATPDRGEYDKLLQAVRTQLAEDTSNDVLEMLALLLTRCPWPMKHCPTNLDLHDPFPDFEEILLTWARSKPSRLLSLPPWPAALLAGKSSKLAAIYLPYLLQQAFMDPASDFAHRAACLTLQSEALAAAVSHALAELDPLVKSALLS